MYKIVKKVPHLNNKFGVVSFSVKGGFISDTNKSSLSSQRQELSRRRINSEIRI